MAGIDQSTAAIRALLLAAPNGLAARTLYDARCYSRASPRR